MFDKNLIIFVITTLLILGVVLIFIASQVKKEVNEFNNSFIVFKNKLETETDLYFLFILYYELDLFSQKYSSPYKEKINTLKNNIKTKIDTIKQLEK